MLAHGNSGALGAFTAGFTGALQAIDALGEVEGEGHLAHVGRAGQQVGVGLAPLP